MATEFIDRIATLLKDLNGGIGSIDDYKYLAWLGLNDKSGKDLISKENLELLKIKFENNVLQNTNSIKC